MGPKNLVTLSAVSKNGKSSDAIRATYVSPPSLLPIASVNFATAKSIISTAEAKKLRTFAASFQAAGLTTLKVFGYTDSVGGINNQKLSVARANATIEYLKKLLSFQDIPVFKLSLVLANQILFKLSHLTLFETKCMEFE